MLSWTQRQVPRKEAEVLPPLWRGHTDQVLPMHMEAMRGCFHVNRVSSGAGWAREGRAGKGSTGTLQKHLASQWCRRMREPGQVMSSHGADHTHACARAHRHTQVQVRPVKPGTSDSADGFKANIPAVIVTVVWQSVSTRGAG